MSSPGTHERFVSSVSALESYLTLWFLLATMVGASACVSASQAGKPPAAQTAAGVPGERATPGLRPREQLPEEAREMLTGRMMRHGDDMGDLTVAVLMLEYDLAHVLAVDMAAEPKLGRPAPGEKGTLNALLPAEFFVQQDALTASAKALAAAAESKDDARIAASFGEVAKACVGCHSAYLNAALDPPASVTEDRTLPCNPEEACGENE